jgi:hypothetical protein
MLSRLRSSLLKAFAAAAISVFALATLGSPANAAPTKEAQFVPSTVLTLKVHLGQSVNGPVVDQVVLRCQPPGGTHPNPWSACFKLNQVDGDFYDLPSRWGYCFFLYRPVTVEANGWWRWHGVHYQETFANRCLANKGTNGVFDF